MTDKTRSERQPSDFTQRLRVPAEVPSLLRAAPGYVFAKPREQLIELALGGAGAEMLWDFFCRELQPLATHPDLLADGREIIECCLGRGTLLDVEAALAPERIELPKTVPR